MPSSSCTPADSELTVGRPRGTVPPTVHRAHSDRMMSEIRRDRTRVRTINKPMWSVKCALTSDLSVCCDPDRSAVTNDVYLGLL